MDKKALVGRLLIISEKMDDYGLASEANALLNMAKCIGNDNNVFDSSETLMSVSASAKRNGMVKEAESLEKMAFDWKGIGQGIKNVYKQHFVDPRQAITTLDNLSKNFNSYLKRMTNVTQQVGVLEQDINQMEASLQAILKVIEGSHDNVKNNAGQLTQNIQTVLQAMAQEGGIGIDELNGITTQLNGIAQAMPQLRKTIEQSFSQNVNQTAPNQQPKPQTVNNDLPLPELQKQYKQKEQELQEMYGLLQSKMQSQRT